MRRQAHTWGRPELRAVWHALDDTRRPCVVRHTLRTFDCAWSGTHALGDSSNCALSGTRLRISAGRALFGIRLRMVLGH